MGRVLGLLPGLGFGFGGSGGDNLAFTCLSFPWCWQSCGCPWSLRCQGVGQALMAQISDEPTPPRLGSCAEGSCPFPQGSLCVSHLILVKKQATLFWQCCVHGWTGQSWRSFPALMIPRLAASIKAVIIQPWWFPQPW